MGWKLKRINLIKDQTIKPNEEKELEICLEPEDRAAIHGVVKFPDGTPVKNAVVKLFKKNKGAKGCNLTPITFTFTDRCGQFLFGVDSCIEYVIKVFFYTPEEVPEPCEPKGCHCEHDHNEFDC